jgi:hypothetical protein
VEYKSQEGDGDGNVMRGEEGRGINAQFCLYKVKNKNKRDEKEDEERKKN